MRGAEDNIRAYFRLLKTENPGVEAYAIVLPVHLRREFADYSVTNEQADEFAASLGNDSAKALTALSGDLAALEPKALERMIEAKARQFPGFRPVFKIVPTASDYTIGDLADFYGVLDVIEDTGTVLFTHLDYIRFINAVGIKEERENSPRQVEKVLERFPNIHMHLAHFGGEQFLFNMKHPTREFWVDHIARLLGEYPNLSVGMEGLVYPASRDIPTQAFFDYVRGKGYFGTFRANGQLVIGSDHPTNGLQDGLVDMMQQCNCDSNVYRDLVRNTTRRFSAQ
jgi:hypothetical protein